ncbi:hypothetical protein C8F01DRAFT_1247920 [Mycena amicta]|nr:hypothetical protein C8F01DRAFT_1247920 [Mycena amicta]
MACKSQKMMQPKTRYLKVAGIAFAVFWNRQVRAQPASILKANERIYFKLPEQLLRHHKKSLQWKASRATLNLGSNAEALEPINRILNDSNRTAIILPALEFDPVQVDFHNDAAVGVSLESFNPMALRSERVAARIAETEQQVSLTPIIPARRQASPPTVPSSSTIGPFSSQHGPTQHFVHQTTLSIHLTNSGTYNALESARPKKKITTEKGKKRCGLCVLAGCSSANTCPGSGARRLCSHLSDAAHKAGMNQRVRKPLKRT